MGLFRDSPGDVSNSSRSNESTKNASGSKDSWSSERNLSNVPRDQIQETQVAQNIDRGNMLSAGGEVLGALTGIPFGNKFGAWAGDALGDATRTPETGIASDSFGGGYYGLGNQGSEMQSGYQGGGGFGGGNNAPQNYFGGMQGGAQDNRSPGQIEMDRQDAFLQYAGGLYHPSMQRGEQASSELFDYYSGNQQPMQNRVNESVMNSPFLAQNIAQGEDAIARNRQATGGFRSGTTQENLAQNSQNQYQNMYNQQLNQNLQGLGMFGDYGANALNNYANFGQGMINDIGTTSGNIQSQNIARDANKQNKQNAWIGAVAQGLGSYFGS